MSHCVRPFLLTIALWFRHSLCPIAGRYCACRLRSVVGLNELSGMPVQAGRLNAIGEGRDTLLVRAQSFTRLIGPYFRPSLTWAMNRPMPSAGQIREKIRRVEPRDK